MEIFGKRPWIQAAIDKFTLEEAIPCAQMAVDCGVDWVEVGTPLIYGEGLESIRELKKIAGDKASIMVDFKIRTNVYDIFLKAKEAGCDVATISCAVGNDPAIIEGLRARQDCGIKIIADLCGSELQDLPKRTEDLCGLGVDAVILHYGDDQWFYNYVREMADGVRECKKVAGDVPIGCCCGYAPPGKGTGLDAYGNVIEAIKQGVDWVVVGGALTGEHDKNAYERFGFLCEFVHSCRK